MWSDSTATQQQTIITPGWLEAAVTAVALWDIARRRGRQRHSRESIYHRKRTA